MQPNYPAQQPPMPQYPQQGYPAQQPYPPAPAYPQQPQPQFPVQPAYPPQGYGQPQYAPQPQAPAQPLPAGSLDSFYQQPSASGGPSFKFKDKPIGTYYEGFVARTVTDADVRPQTDRQGAVQTYKDGRPKFVMVVPMAVQPSQEFQDGQAGWWVKGQARDELARAMNEAGAPAGAPEAGAWIRVTLVGQRQIPGGFSPAYQYKVEYRRPQGAGPAPQQAPAVEQVTGAPAVQATPIPQANFAPAQNPQVGAQPMPPVQQAAPAPQQSAPAPAAAPTQGPSGFNAEQQALFAKLTGQSAG